MKKADIKSEVIYLPIGISRLENSEEYFFCS